MTCLMKTGPLVPRPQCPSDLATGAIQAIDTPASAGFLEQKT